MPDDREWLLVRVVNASAEIRADEGFLRSLEEWIGDSGQTTPALEGSLDALTDDIGRMRTERARPLQRLQALDAAPNREAPGGVPPFN